MDAAQSQCGGDRLPEERTVAAAGAVAGERTADGNDYEPPVAEPLLDLQATQGVEGGVGEPDAIGRDDVGLQDRHPATCANYGWHWKQGELALPGARGPDLVDCAVPYCCSQDHRARRVGMDLC